MTVKRIGTRQETYELGHLKLYREDLEEIAKAVSEVGPLKISCGDWRMNDPADFADPELPEALPDLVMTAQRPDSSTGVMVDLGARVASVKVAEPDTHIEGVLSRIQRITEPRQRGLLSLAKNPEVGWMAVFLKPRVAAKTVTISSAVLVNAYRDDRPTFWERRRDELLINAVTLVLGAVLGYLVNVIT